MFYNKRALAIVVAVALLLGVVALASYAAKSTPDKCCATMDAKAHKDAAKCDKADKSCPMGAAKSKAAADKCDKASGQCDMKHKATKTSASKACPMGGSKNCSTSECEKGKATATAKNARTVTLKLKGLMCDPCAASVAKSLRSVSGVSKARVTVRPMQAVVTYDPAKTNVNALKKAVRQASTMHKGQKFDVVN